jgi:hypothetical protein
MKQDYIRLIKSLLTIRLEMKEISNREGLMSVFLLSIGTQNKYNVYRKTCLTPNLD